MKRTKMLGKNRYLILLFSLFFLHNQNEIYSNTDFIKSFVHYYELSNEGRFTHEYHPFLLKKTAQSFQELENRLMNNGYQLAHRILIMGYEKAAAPHYFFSPQESKGEAINDEMLNKTLFGFTQKNHNLFGFMTGFLFKQMPSTQEFFTSHINPKNIILFDPRAQRFQQDFFGSLYHFLRSKENQITKALFQQKGDLLMEECIDFWNTLYAHNSNNKENASAGTQDILFTIEHARQIKESSVPLKAFFTGADITYPINETSKKKRSATRNAQEMVAQFSEHLKPINNLNTLYVFRSFVDGVGKSTMLSNIKNWKAYKTDTALYKTTDNASSQTAEIFEYDNQVYIADLPAQLSHFTYKPDGAVFVEYEACTMIQSSKEELLTHITKNEKEIKQHFYENLKKTGALNRNLLSTKTTDDHFTAYLKNLILLEIDQPYDWTPFIYKGQTFIFDKKLNIRASVSLAHAPSEGLKNSAPEQMLFTSGIRFPLPYQIFLDDLNFQAKKYEIKQIVFVDFLSMYARSSREAIRLNYLIQQIKILFPLIQHQKSFYAHFSSNAELLYQLMQPDFFQKSLQYIAAESLIRSELFTIVSQERYQNLQGVSLDEVSHTINQALSKTSSKTEEELKARICKKLSITESLLKENYAQSKEFVHLFSHDGTQLYRLSKLIEKTLSTLHFSFKNPWRNNGKKVLEKEEVEVGPCDRIVELDNGQKMRALYVFNPKKHSLIARADFFQLLKKWWIPTLLSSMKVRLENENLIGKKMHFPLAPLFIKKGVNDLWYCLQPKLSSITTLIEQKGLDDLNIQSKQKIKWGTFYEKPFITDFNPADTHTGLYGFGYSNLQSFSSKMFPQILDEAVSQIIKPLFEPLRSSDTISLLTVVETLKKEKKYSLITWCHKECKKQIKEQKEKKNKTGDKKEKKEKKNNSFKKKKIKAIDQEVLPWILKLSQLLATVILHAPDAQSPFSFQLNNQNDFSAALWLIQKILLPQYLGIFYVEEKWQKNKFKTI